MSATKLATISPEPTRESLRLLATLALDAYDRQNNWPGCVVQSVDNHVSGMSATIVADVSRIVVSFRGTEPRDWRDWKRDANLRLVPYRLGGLVHAGFLSGWVSLWTHVLDALDEVRELLNCQAQERGKDPPKPLLVVNGHSLGGATATLAAEALDADLCVTFGSPRVGCDFFAKGFDRRRRHRHLRVVHGNDIVPRCPFPMPYRHCGELVYLDRKSRILIDPSFYTVGVDRVLGFRFDLIRDHLLGRYLEALS